MEKNLVKKLENYIRPRLKKIIDLGDTDRQINVLSNIIKTVTGEEEGTEEFFEYYDYSMNKILYPDADMDMLNEAVEITLQNPDEYIDLGNDANPDTLNEAEGTKKRSIGGKIVDKGMSMATSRLGDNRFKRRNRLRKDTNAAKKAGKKLDKAKIKGKSEEKIAKLQSNAKSKNMRKTAATIAVKSDENKKAKKTNESEMNEGFSVYRNQKGVSGVETNMITGVSRWKKKKPAAKKTNESETPLLEKCLNESFQWKENYGDDKVTKLNDMVTNDDSLYNEPSFDELFERINGYVAQTLNIDSMSDECMGITHEIIEEYELFDVEENIDSNFDASYLDELGDLSWVEQE